ncbi:MAG TPA: VOC family protein [Jatrophihabitantaceae bacterium]|jgi:predicted enzyme related to lactoylglutathione lyase|nr:VOC family protein [Jatrophihabitantaceae bacterium]
MTTRDTPFAPGTPCWVDLLSSDAEGAKAFYGSLFGWTFNDAGPDFGGYVTFLSDGHNVAGMMQKTADMPMPDGWSTYLSTADAVATVAAATAAGGQVLMEPMAVADLGSMAMLADSSGGAFGLWQAGTHTGFGKYNEPGSVTWDEYHSKDFAATTSFYPKVFGWTLEKTSDTDEFRYYTAQVNGETVAGIMDSASFLPAEVPSHWTLYFSVPDVDAAVAKAVELGGSVVRPGEDTPFGRMADLLDPTGAGFKLHSATLSDGTTIQPT